MFTYYNKPRSFCKRGHNLLLAGVDNFKSCTFCKKEDSKKWSSTHLSNKAESAKKWREKNPEKAKYHAKKQKFSKYGITEQEYNKLFLEQKGLCDICYRHQSEFRFSLAVDHCHKTKKVRGLLCGDCNTAIGLFHENVKAIENSIKYLKKSDLRSTVI